MRSVKLALDLVWIIYNMVFESGGVPEEWRTATIVPLYKGDEQGGFRSGSECVNVE